MLLRMSTLFLRTLRDDPADAEVPSHRLLVRAGYVRRVAPGVFTWLPLGYIVLRNVEEIVRKQMVDAGFQEVHFPALLPREPYEATGRWAEYGPTLFRLQDRTEADYLLGPTHEEMFTLLVKSENSSYKALPVSLFQIHTKYRDEHQRRRERQSAGDRHRRPLQIGDEGPPILPEMQPERDRQHHRQPFVHAGEVAAADAEEDRNSRNQGDGEQAGDGWRGRGRADPPSSPRV